MRLILLGTAVPLFATNVLMLCLSSWIAFDIS
jgi:hypothetical protein